MENEKILIREGKSTRSCGRLTSSFFRVGKSQNPAQLEGNHFARFFFNMNFNLYSDMMNP